MEVRYSGYGCEGVINISINMIYLDAERLSSGIVHISLLIAHFLPLVLGDA